MAKPTRKQRQKDVYTVVAGPILLLGLWIMFQFNFTNLYYIIGLVFFAVIMGSICASFVPDMRKKENKHKNMYTGLTKAKTKNASYNKAVKDNSSNLLRTEKEILKLPLEKLSWREFEELCYLYYKAKGYKPRRTSEGADGGVDLIIFDRNHNTEVAIQIKHYKKGKQIDVKLIRELDSAKKNHGCILAEMITSSSFTNPALVEADRRNIKCRSNEWVHSKLLPWRKQQMKKKGLA
ncbi:restriction endonuclease [Aquibacillus sediminis]|uniref:restriction endonuclease n=1 Tax=Aquibacillus sediminis TaxID=2574734 RepID=UPI0011091951|nr:restriction endonuclease [Aquibacillus sediminis]